MVALQGVVAGAIGLGLGLGLASAFGLSNNPDRLAFVMTWHIPVITAGAVLVIVVGASLISMIRVIRLDPKSVFQG
jgi:putative ABC transport system permease protein